MAHINKLHYKENLNGVKADIVAKGVFEDDKKHWTITSGQMKGKVGDLAFSFTKKEKTLFFGLGKKKEATAENFRRAGGAIVNFLIDKKYGSEINYFLAKKFIQQNLKYLFGIKSYSIISGC